MLVRLHCEGLDTDYLHFDGPYILLSPLQLSVLTLCIFNKHKKITKLQEGNFVFF